MIFHIFIHTVYFCCDCEAEVLKSKQDDHLIEVHQGRKLISLWSLTGCYDVMVNVRSTLK